MNIWLVMVLGGLATFLIRLSFIWLYERLRLPDVLRRALRFVPPAVLSVIIFQELLIRDGALSLGLDNNRMLAGLVAVLVAWRTRNALVTIVIGMLALFLLQALLPA